MVLAASSPIACAVDHVPEAKGPPGLLGWQLVIHDSNATAAAEVIDESPPHLRVMIGSPLPAEAWGIQLNRLDVVVDSGASYFVAFEARATRKRTLRIGVAMGHEP